MSALSAATAPQAPVDYTTQFQNALTQARGNINQQLMAAMGDIQNSQAAAGQALGTLPGAINQSYGQALGTMGNAENMIEAAQKKSGVGSLTPLQSYMQPVDAAIHGSEAAAQANVPLLQVAIQQQTAQQRAAAQMAAMGDMGGLNQQLMSFYGQQAGQEAAAKQQAEQAAANALQNYNYSKQLQDDPNRNFGPSSTAGTAQLTDKQGIPLGYTGNDVAKAKASPSFSRATQAIQAAQAITDPKKSAQQQAQIWFEMQQVYKNQPAMLAALASTFPNGQPPTPQQAELGKANYTGLDISGPLKGFTNTMSKLPGGIKRS